MLARWEGEAGLTVLQISQMTTSRGQTDFPKGGPVMGFRVYGKRKGGVCISELFLCNSVLGIRYVDANFVVET